MYIVYDMPLVKPVMDSLLLLCIIGGALATIHPLEEDTSTDLDILDDPGLDDLQEQSCYECSSASALCRDSVYDGSYLSRTRCESVCFLRKENDIQYRGCFDGWRGGLVKSDYKGCQTQNYLGTAVEWCFCTGSGHEPCNGASRELIIEHYEMYPETVTDATEKLQNQLQEIENNDYDYVHDPLADTDQVYKLSNFASKRVLPRDEAPLDNSYKTGRYSNTEKTAPKEKTYKSGVYSSPDSTKTDDYPPGSRYDPYEYDPSKDAAPVTFSPPEERSFNLDLLAQPTFADDPVQGSEMKYEDQSQDDFSAQQDARVEDLGDLCGGRTDGTYPDEADCTRYYHCSNGYPYHMSCSVGTVWNNQLKGCSFTYHTGIRCHLPRRMKEVQGSISKDKNRPEEKQSDLKADNKYDFEVLDVSEHTPEEYKREQPEEYKREQPEEYKREQPEEYTKDHHTTTYKPQPYGDSYEGHSNTRYTTERAPQLKKPDNSYQQYPNSRNYGRSNGAASKNSITPSYNTQHTSNTPIEYENKPAVRQNARQFKGTTTYAPKISQKHPHNRKHGHVQRYGQSNAENAHPGNNNANGNYKNNHLSNEKANGNYKNNYPTYSIRGYNTNRYQIKEKPQSPAIEETYHTPPHTNPTPTLSPIATPTLSPITYPTLSPLATATLADEYRNAYGPRVRYAFDHRYSNLTDGGRQDDYIPQPNEYNKMYPNDNYNNQSTNTAHQYGQYNSNNEKEEEPTYVVHKYVPNNSPYISTPTVRPEIQHPQNDPKSKRRSSSTSRYTPYKTRRNETVDETNMPLFRYARQGHRGPFKTYNPAPTRRNDRITTSQTQTQTASRVSGVHVRPIYGETVEQPTSRDLKISETIYRPARYTFPNKKK